MSLLLVLAMVLAMVPAVLAAPYGTPEKNHVNHVMEMGVEDEIRFPRTEDTKAATAINNADSVTWSVSGSSRWGSGTTTTLATIDGTSGKYTILTAKGATGSTPVVLRATVVNGTGSAATTTYYDWTITITKWGIQMQPATMNLGSSAQTLTATVTGPKASPVEAPASGSEYTGGGFAAARVKFKSNSGVNISGSKEDNSAETDYLALNSRNGVRAVSVNAVPASHDGMITATLKYVRYYVDVNTDTQKSEEVTSEAASTDIYIIGAGDDALHIMKGSDDVTGKTVSTMTSAKTVARTVSRGGSSSGSYSWSSSDPAIASFASIANRSNGTLTINKEGTVTVTVTALVDGTTATCTVQISNAVVTVESIGYADTTIKELETKGKKFTTDAASTYPVTNNYTVNEITLEAQISAPGNEGNQKIEWSVDSPSYATITKVNDTNGNATNQAKLKALYPGKVKVTAKIQNVKGTSSKSMDIQIWTAKPYSKQEVPSPTFTSGTANAVAAQLSRENATITLKSTGAKVSRPLKNVKALTANGTLQITGEIDGVDSTNAILYYPEKDADDRTSNATGKFKLTGTGSTGIDFFTQPQSSTYKINDDLTGESLFVDVGTTKSSYYLTSVAWYNVANAAVPLQTETYKQTDAVTRTTSSLNLKTLVQKGVISGPGEYTFMCVATAKNRTETITTNSNGATITMSGDYIVDITVPKTTINVGDSIEIYGVAQTYNPSSRKYVNVTAAHTVTWTMNESSLASLSKTSTSNTANAASVGKTTLTAKSGGKLTLTAKVELGNNTYTGTKTITIEIPTADTVRLTLGENDSYVLLDGSKLAAAVKDVCKTTPSTFVFKSPANGTLYTTSSLSNTASTSTKYSASEVSKMAYRPTRTTGTHEIEYTAYDGSAQIATGKVLVMTSASTVKYFISANEKQQMVVSDFQSVYGTGLSSVTFSSNTDSRGGLYKGSTTSSGKVGSESYSVSSGTNLLRNVYFIADSTVSKYSVTIPFTANGSSGPMSGQLVVYVNDTHTLSSTGATFRSMGIAAELAPDNATGSTYITIDRVVGGKLYSSYTSIKRCTALTSKDLGSTKFYFTGSNSLDNLYVLPMADSKSVDVTYTIDGITKGTLSFKVNQQKASNQFTDVVANFSWAANSVDFMYTNDIIKGNSSTNPRIFGPRAMMTRAMLVTVLYRAAGEPTVAGITNKFTDNKEGKYYYNAVLWASNMGIVNGSTATTFEPNGNITREQIAAILYRYAGSPTVTGSLSGYPDQAQVSSFAVSAMQWAVSNGIINGVNDGSKTTLSAKGNATRAQVAVMLHRFLTFD